jgi:N-acetylneuraminic acid mutarotase
MWLTCGESGSMQKNAYYSTDGKNWTAVVNTPYTTRVAPTYFTFGDMMYLGCGYDDTNLNTILGDLWRSADGYTWEKVTDTVSYGPIMKQAAVNFNGKVYLIGGSTDSGTGNSVNNVYASQ